MIQKTLYRISDGEILSVVSGQDGFIQFPDVDGCAYIDGAGNAKTERVVGGKIVGKPQLEIDEAEIAAAWTNLRKTRDTLLQKCDWTQVPDAPVDQAAWATYRQALRDLPSTVDDPQNVVWPTPPQV